MAADGSGVGTSKRGRIYKTAADVLAVLFALSSDSESEDDLDEHDNTDVNDATISSVSSGVADISDDDDDVLYRLASDISDDEPGSDEEDNSGSQVSNAEESDWSKTPIPLTDLDFDAVNVIPKNVFLLSDGPLQFFNRFFDDELIELLVQQTTLYAKQSKLQHWDDVTADEMNAFLAILIAMGMHQLPNAELFWSTDPLFHVQPVADIMPVKRFKKILQGLHINDNTKALKHGDPQYDRLYKVRPLLLKLNKEFNEQCISSTSQSIDEAMILFKDRSSLKQYMPLKPVKPGYKVWVRSYSRTVYIYQFDIYTGKAADGQADVGLGSRIVLSLSEAVHDTNCNLTFDNFFSSHSLKEDLYSRIIYATATVRSNRKGLPVLERQQSRLRKGEFKWRSKENTTYLQWMNTKLVHILSIAFNSTEMCQVRGPMSWQTVNCNVCYS